MRHGKKYNHLGRKSAHRKALMRNLSIALIEHKRITTTLAKAKALRLFIEPLVTKAKDNTQHSRRVVFSYLQNKEAVKELFGPIAVKVSERPGGYIRIIKMGFRRSDSTEMALIEFVDFNDVYQKSEGSADGSGKRRRRRRGGKNKSEDTVVVEEVTSDVAEEVAEDVEEVVEEVEETVDDVVAEETVEEATEETKAASSEEEKDSDEEKA